MKKRGCLIFLGAVGVLTAVGALLLVGLAFLIGQGFNVSIDVCRGADDDLRSAARSGDLAAMRALLDAGADPNAPDRQENTPLGCAIPRGNTAAVALLLSRGADPNQASGANQYRELPLGLAMKQPDDSLTVILLDHGVDPNGVLPGRARPLAAAYAGVRPAVAAALLAHGADADGGPDPERPVSCPPLTPTDGQYGSLESTAPCAAPPRLPLQSARSVASTTELLDRGADPNGREGRRPLYDAVQRGDAESVEMLMRRGADPTRAVTWGATRSVRDAGLLAAVDAGSLPLVDRMLTAGADPNVTAYRSALSRATVAHDEAMVRRLLDAGADPRADGMNVPDTCRVVQQVHLPPTAPPACGPAPSGTAVGLPPSTGAPNFLDPGTNFVDPAFVGFHVPPAVVAAASGDEATLALLLQHGADPNTLALDSFTALAAASSRCDGVAVRALLAAGADPAAGREAMRPVDVVCDDLRPLVAR